MSTEGNRIIKKERTNIALNVVAIGVALFIVFLVLQDRVIEEGTHCPCDLLIKENIQLKDKIRSLEE